MDRIVGIQREKGVRKGDMERNGLGDVEDFFFQTVFHHLGIMAFFVSPNGHRAWELRG
jgi:hypothetical protein